MTFRHISVHRGVRFSDRRCITEDESPDNQVTLRKKRGVDLLVSTNRVSADATDRGTEVLGVLGLRGRSTSVLDIVIIRVGVGSVSAIADEPGLWRFPGTNWLVTSSPPSADASED